MDQGSYITVSKNTTPPTHTHKEKEVLNAKENNEENKGWFEGRKRRGELPPHTKKEFIMYLCMFASMEVSVYVYTCVCVHLCTCVHECMPAHMCAPWKCLFS